MLKYLREANNRPVAKILMGLLIFSFVGWGAADWILGGGTRGTDLVKIGDGEISLTTFDMEKSRIISSLSREEQKEIYTNPDAARMLNAQILSGLTSRLMLENRANDLNMTVSNAEVANIIKQMPEFQENGEFSVQKFDYLLAANNLTERDFSNIIRSQTLREMITGGIAGRVMAPKFAAVAIANSRGKQREIEYASVKYEDYKTNRAPTDSELSDTYAQNPQLIPETRNISYILLETDMKNPDKFDSGFAKMQSMEDEIIGGKSLADTAREFGAKYTELKNKEMDINDEIVSRGFETDAGNESEIMEMKNGFVIVRTNEIIPAHNAKFEDVKQDMIGKWRTSNSRTSAYKVANEKLIALNNGENLGGKRVIVGRANGAPNEVLVMAFSQAVGTKMIVPGEKEFYVLNVIDEKIPKTTGTNAAREEATKFLNGNIADDYMNFLTRVYKITENKKLMQRLFE